MARFAKVRITTAVVLALLPAVPAVKAQKELVLPWEKPTATPAPSQAVPPSEATVSPVERVYRKCLDEMHANAGGQLRVGSPRKIERGIQVAITAKDETISFAVVEKSNDGKRATVVAGIANSEGEVFRLEYQDGQWLIVEAPLHVPQEEADGAASGDPHLTAGVSGFMDELLAGDVSSAYRWTTKEYREKISETAFVEFVNRWPALTSIRSWKTREALDRRGVGIVRVEVLQLGGAKQNLEFHLDPTGDGLKWRVRQIAVLSAEGSVLPQGQSPPAAVP